SKDLKTSIEIIRNRVDGLGVAEPQITQQGNNIVIELPGVKNQQRALEVVGRTAQLLFRPVLQTLPFNETTTAPGQPPIKTTPPEQDDPSATVILPDKNKRVRYQLGPAELTGKDLALVLKYGALPVQLVPQTVETVSATLGKDSVRWSPGGRRRPRSGRSLHGPLLPGAGLRRVAGPRRVGGAAVLDHHLPGSQRP